MDPVLTLPTEVNFKSFKKVAELHNGSYRAAFRSFGAL